jgi:4-hydroxy-tetrahydrodipicolinate reductase
VRIALLGYGKMGKAVERVAEAKGHEIVYKINLENANNFLAISLKNVDVAIDFSMPTSAYDNIMKCFDANVPVVVGTTGWYDQFDEVKKRCIKEGQSMIYSSNFSLGVNIFFKINKLLARYMGQRKDYDVMIEEVHHTEKKDHPSGTALSLAKQILEPSQTKHSWKARLFFDKNEDVPMQSLQPDELLIESKRIKDVPGDHTVIYSSANDSITIKHSAITRNGFAEGAVLAAEWILGKKGIYTMEDLLKLD